MPNNRLQISVLASAATTASQVAQKRSRSYTAGNERRAHKHRLALHSHILFTQIQNDWFGFVNVTCNYIVIQINSLKPNQSSIYENEWMNDWLIGRDEKWDDQVFSSLNWNSLDASSFSSQAYSFYLEQTDKIEKNNKSLIGIVLKLIWC